MKLQLLGRVSILAVLAASFPAVSMAQTAPKPAAAEQADETKPDEPADNSRPEDVVVTGSRVQLRDVRRSEPTITTVNQEYLSDRNLTNVADALNEIPGIRGSVTPAGAQGGFGQAVNFINIGGLGSNRTLTLINGQRVVSSNVSSLFSQGAAGQQVDANIIPSALTKQVDIVLVGGAPVYGSDAIAGTVNYILDTRFKGLRTYALAGVTERGDGFRYNANLTFGRDFAEGRGNFTFSYTRDSQQGVLGNSRDFILDDIGGATNPTAAQAAGLGRAAGITSLNDGRVNTGIGFDVGTPTDNIPGTVQVRNLTISFLTPGGLITAANSPTNASLANVIRNFQFDASGNVVPFARGIPFVGINSSGGDGFKFSDYSQITSDLVRNTVNAYLSFRVTPSLELFAEGTYYTAFGNELVQQPTFNSSLFAGNSGPLTFDVNSAFLTPQARTQLQALNVNTFQISRASSDLADVTGFSNIELYRFVAGAKGEFSLFGRTFNYSVVGNYGRTSIVDTSQDLNAQNFVNAVNVTTNAAGQVVCTATPTRNATPGFTPVADAACRPLNLLGFGRADPAARAYVIAENNTRSLIEQYDFQANLNGKLFKIFGNETGFNIGYEHREEFGAFTPSDFQQRGLGRSAAIAPVSGNFKLNEVYGEVTLPIITPKNDLWFLNQFQVFGRGRYVDNTVNGGFFSWAAGGLIAPTRDIAFRGNYTRSFRAPAITELFLPVSNAFSAVPDLCSPTNINAGAAPAIRARNCAAFLAAFPNATPLDAASATVPSRSSGNPNLQNEIADSFTYGVAITPRWLRGFTLEVDYINIKISNPIANLAVAAINTACFDNPNFNLADPANGNAFCSRIGRYAQGQGGVAANGGNRGGQVIVDPVNPAVVAGFINGNRIFYDGIQARATYGSKLSGLGLPGAVSLRGDFTYVRTRINDITGVAPVRTDGVIGDPTLQGQVNFSYNIADFGFNMSANYIGEQLFSRVTRGPGFREVDKLESYWIFNPNIYFNVDKRFRLNFAITNLTNYQGQRYFGIILPASNGADQLGRRFTVSVQGKF